MLDELVRRIWYFLRRDRMGTELAEEMRLHVELREEALRRSGLGADEARFVARRRFGNQTSLHQRSRDMWGLGGLDRLMQDVRYATRRLAHRRGFTVAVVSVLALGVGATTAMFSAVDAALLRPLPFLEPRELVTLHNIQIPFEQESRSSPDDHWALDIVDVAEMPDVISHVAAYASGGLNLADSERPHRVQVGVVTSEFFRTLGIGPAHGRPFTDAEGVAGGPAVAILSDGLWSRQFGRNPVLGRRLQLGARSYEVVGIMPRGFGFPGESDVWIPLTVPTTFQTFEPFRGWLPSSVIGRVADGMTIEAAGERLLARWKQMRAASPPTPGRSTGLDRVMAEIDRVGTLTPLQRALVGDRRSALLVLLGATGLLLLIACANVTNLLLTQAAIRRREIAIREVLGATRGRVVRQLLTESLLLSIGGAALGVALAPVALATMSALMPTALAGLAPAEIDLRVLTFAAVLALMTGLGFGLWPALGTTREAPIETIKTGGGVGSTAIGGRRARRVLVAAEVALTLILLVGAGLMLRSFERLMDLDAGIEQRGVGTLELAFSRGTPPGVRLERIEAILDRLSALPAVDAAGVINDLPLRGGSGISISVDVEGASRAGDAGPRFARWLMASTDYFETLGVPLLRGRPFATSDDSLAPRVAIINESMAKQFWPGRDALGRTFRAGGPGDPPVTVVGIVGDVRESGLESDVDPQMFFPIYEAIPDRLAVVARSGMRPSALLATMGAAVRAVDPMQAVYNVRMMDEVVGASLAPRRTNTLVISAFAALALLLASLGVYATISYAVAQRSRELGIRAALGARGSDLIALVSGEMVWVIAAGLIVGLAGAWALARVMTSLLYEIDPHDLTTFAIVPIVVAIAAIAATLGPAWAARRVDPVEVLRAD
jgi:predicted permease